MKSNSEIWRTFFENMKKNVQCAFLERGRLPKTPSKGPRSFESSFGERYKAKVDENHEGLRRLHLSDFWCSRKVFESMKNNCLNNFALFGLKNSLNMFKQLFKGICTKTSAIICFGWIKWCLNIFRKMFKQLFKHL